MMKLVSLLLALVSLTLLATNADARWFQRRCRGCQSTTVTTKTTVRVKTSGCADGVCPVPAKKASADSNDALDALNGIRAAKGLRPFLRCDGLMAAAQAAAQYRAERRIQGHTSNDFAFVPAGEHAARAGCSAVGPEWGFLACCDDENWTFAGAASVDGGDGRIYHQLFVK